MLRSGLFTFYLSRCELQIVYGCLNPFNEGCLLHNKKGSEKNIHNLQLALACIKS